jgi:hypothetical protein
MKAYIARYYDSEWCMLVHGENVSEAKKNFYNWNPGFEEGDYIDIRLIRLKLCDDKPFTFENAKNAGFHYVYEGYNGYDDNGDNIEYPDLFINDCRCEVCIGAKKINEKQFKIYGILD